MNLTKEKLSELRGYKEDPQYDDIRVKEKIKETLLQNDLLLYVLNNKKLVESEAEADEYFNRNIFSHYIIDPTQTEVKNLISYEVKFTETTGADDRMKMGQIVFVVMCDPEDIIEKTTFIARHDLLAAMLIKEFNRKNYFGFTSRIISDEPSVLDDNYACRTLVFELTTYNNITN